jgi:hypothetical protein
MRTSNLYSVLQGTGYCVCSMYKVGKVSKETAGCEVQSGI